ncbi:MAG: hypothetical protein M3Z33_09845 [Actinomycetota bacterium]|nr:hypothetical protein [Actinomycetota bacterium]
MRPGDDLSAEALEAVIPGRPLQTHPVVLSTAVTAAAWAEADAPDGAVVVAGHQISPRGHADRPWKLTPGGGLGLSVVLRPQLPPQREAWLYIVATLALADVCAEGSLIRWPDEVRRGDVMTAAVGMQVHLGPAKIKWAVVNLWLPEVEPPRGPVLAALLEAIDARQAGDPGGLLEDYARRSATIGRRISARLLGGTGPRMQGTAIGANEEGCLVIETDAGARAPLRPQDVRGVEEVETPPAGDKLTP